jgi:AcrR family transcriptional regulator
MTSHAARQSSRRSPGPGPEALTGSRRRDREVLDAAARLFYESGYTAASVKDVADALGILKGSLYHYIQTKEDLLFRLLEETHDEMDQMLETVAGLDRLSPLERLDIYVRRHVEYSLANLTRVVVYYQDLERLSQDRRKRIFARRRDHERWVAGVIEEAQSHGLADPALVPTLAARFVFGTIIWSYRWYREGRDDGGRVADVCAAYVLRGVVGAAGRQASPGVVDGWPNPPSDRWD